MAHENDKMYGNNSVILVFYHSGHAQSLSLSNGSDIMQQCWNISKIFLGKFIRFTRIEKFWFKLFTKETVKKAYLKIVGLGWVALLQSKRMFSCEQHCSIVPQYCSFDRQIALSNLEPTRTNCKLKFTKDLWTKPWLDYKKEGSTNPVAQTIWLASLFLIVQSEALWISTCNLFASVANCSEQSAYENCNIVGQYCNVARKRTSGLTVSPFCRGFYSLEIIGTRYLLFNFYALFAQSRLRLFIAMV
jgi:hypothetical protein